MTNSKEVLKSNSSNTDKACKKKVNQSENLLSNKNANNLGSLTANYEVKSPTNTEQILKKAVTRSRTNKTNKVLYKKNLQETDNVKDKTCTDSNTTVDQSKKKHVALPDKKKIINKENRISHNSSPKTNFSNHKLTEYFSDLKVNENLKNVVSKEVNLKEEQVKHDDKSTDKTAKNDSQLSESLKNLPKILKQRKTKTNPELINHKLTEYYHIRRSERKYTKKIIDEKQTDLENKILNQVEDGLKIKEFEDKGRGIITSKEFCKGDFVIEYIGDLIDGVVAKQREIKYAKNKNIGCYMYYFKHKNIQYCIDATKESGKLGRLINHSRKGNLVSRIIEIQQIPHLILFAKTDISIGTELLYDYGDRRQESVRNYPWLNL